MGTLATSGYIIKASAQWYFPQCWNEGIWVGILVYKSCLSCISSILFCYFSSHLLLWFITLFTLFFEPFFMEEGFTEGIAWSCYGADLTWDVSRSSFYSLFPQFWIVQTLFLSFLLTSYHIAAHLVCSQFSPLCLQRQFKQLLLSQIVK